MMSTLLFGAALAAMPAGVDLNDVTTWDRRADALIDGPPGCWEVVGRATWRWELGRFGGSEGDAVFVGRLVDGQWSTVHLEPLGEIRRERDVNAVRVYAKEARFAPLVGKLIGARMTVSTESLDVPVETDEAVEASNLLRRTLARIGGSSEASWASWDDAQGAVVLHRSTAIEGGGEAEQTVRFPAGAPQPTALDVTFPESFRAGSWPRRFKIRDASVKIRGVVAGEHTFPASEAFTFDFGLFGWWGSGAQTIRYERIAPCPAKPVTTADTPADPPPPSR